MSNKYHKHSGQPSKHKYVCQFCNLEFYCISVYEKHAQTHTKGKVFMCTMCATNCSSKYELAKHFLTIHSLQNLFSCDLCNKKFASLKQKHAHQKLHKRSSLSDGTSSKENPSACSFFDVNEMKHINTHNEECVSPANSSNVSTDNKKYTNKPLVIKICINNSHNRSKNTVNINSDFSSETIKSKCIQNESEIDPKKDSENVNINSCSMADEKNDLTLANHNTINNKEYSNLKSTTVVLSQTINEFEESPNISHITSGHFTCDVCSETYCGIVELYDHYISHIGQKAFVCQACGIRFNTKYGLYLHGLGHTSVRKTGIIPNSERSIFSAESSLSLPALKSHTSRKSYDCDACGRSFETEYQLNVHEETHKNYLDYTCLVCKESFWTLRALQRHIPVHNGRNFACEFCHKLFNSEEYLLEHLKCHMGTQYRYICEICGSKNRFSSELQSHLKLRHSKQIFTCSRCDQVFAKLVHWTKHFIDCNVMRK